MKEELGLLAKNVSRIHVGSIIMQDAPKYKKTWIIFPVLVSVNTDKVALDWEAKNHAWVTFGEAKKLKLLPGFDGVLQAVSVFV